VRRNDQQPLVDLLSKRGPGIPPSPAAGASSSLPSANPLMHGSSHDVREAMMARAAALGRGAMAQTAAAAVVSSTGLKRIFALAEQAKEGAAKKDGFRRLFNN
jgi:anti-sigma factor ChrR (cupin superfamily)